MTWNLDNISFLYVYIVQRILIVFGYIFELPIYVVSLEC